MFSVEKIGCFFSTSSFLRVFFILFFFRKESNLVFIIQAHYNTLRILPCIFTLSFEQESYKKGFQRKYLCISMVNIIFWVNSNFCEIEVKPKLNI